MLFQKDDILKVKLDQLEFEYGGCAGTTAYEQMLKAAETYSFKVLEVGVGQYKIQRLPDLQIDIKSAEEVHRLLEKVNPQ